MKGLLYKEWCMGKKTCVLFLVLSLVFSLLGMLVFLSTICGNLQSWPSEEADSIKMFTIIFFYVPFILMLFAATGVNQTIYTDYESGWMKYSYTIPKKASKVIGAKYIYAGIVFVISFVYGLLNAGLICLMSKETFSVNILKNMVVIMVVAVCEMSVVIPFAMKFKQGRTLSTVGAVFFMVVYAISGYVILELEKKYPETSSKILEEFFVNARDVVAYLSPVIIILLTIVSFFVSCKIYQGREK